MSFFLLTTIAVGQTIIIDRPQTPNGLLSSFWDNDDAGIYSADYFQLENPVQISSLTFPGFTVWGGNQVPVDGLALDFNVYIFPHDGSQPLGYPDDAADAVLVLSNLDLDDEAVIIDGGPSNMSTTFIVDVAAANGGEEVILPAGEYWITAFPTIELSDPLWYWLGSDIEIPYASVIIDPEDLMESGITEWTLISLVTGDPFPSFAWTMMGEEVLSVEDNSLSAVSIFPNPATDVINIQTPTNISVESVQMFDILGKNVSVNYTNGTINTSALSNGVYVLQVNTDQGTLTQKVVKQ